MEAHGVSPADGEPGNTVVPQGTTPDSARFKEVTQDQIEIIATLTESEKDGLSPVEFFQRTRMSSGRLYPALFALERQGKIKSAWVDGPYPRHRLYHLV